MPEKVSGKWVIAVIFTVSILLAGLRWKLIPKQNPKAADPGNPYYTPPQKQSPNPKQPLR